MQTVDYKRVFRLHWLPLWPRELWMEMDPGYCRSIIAVVCLGAGGNKIENLPCQIWLFIFSCFWRAWMNFEAQNCREPHWMVLCVPNGMLFIFCGLCMFMYLLMIKRKKNTILHIYFINGIYCNNWCDLFHMGFCCSMQMCQY